MKIIDAHTHLFATPHYLENLIKTMDKLDIEKCCISGLGDLFLCLGNKDVKKAMEEYPDRIIGAYFIRPGVDEEEDIRNAYSDGFKMIKITIPKSPYNDIKFHSLWETAQDLGLPVLFHTGIVTTLKNAPKENINSWFMHPMRIEPIANAFPNLNIIIAHLGVHWNADAAEIVRMKKNVYVDLTGEPNGWRKRADSEGMKKYLWWENAFQKVIFGTDVLYPKIEQILKEDFERLNTYQINQKTRELIFSGNIEKMLNSVK